MNMSILTGAIATSQWSPLTPHMVHVHVSTQFDWFQWAYGVLIALGILAAGMIAVWLARVLVVGVWESVTVSVESGDEGVANAPPYVCLDGYVAPLQKCNGGTKPCAVCQLHSTLQAHADAVANLCRTRAILTEIASQPDQRGETRPPNPSPDHPA